MSKTCYSLWGGGELCVSNGFFVAFYAQNAKTLHHSIFAFSVFIIASLLMFNLYYYYYYYY